MEPKTQEGVLVIYKSANGVDGWEPVKAVDVPKWLVESPEILGRAVDGEACRNDDPGLLMPVEARPWYIAKRVISEQEMSVVAAAQAKRERKQRIRLLREHTDKQLVVVH